MPHPLHDLIFFGVRTFFDLSARKQTLFKKGAMGKDLLCKKHYGLTSVFGWEGDRHAPIAFVDGSYLLRDRGNVLIHFGFERRDITSKVDWYCREDLPCLVSAFQVGEVAVKVENFADKVTVNGSDYVAAYSAVTVKNEGKSAFRLPKVSRYLTTISDPVSIVPAGETKRVEFAVWADRFGKVNPFPEDALLQSLGSFDEHFEHMKKYWEERLSGTVQLHLPEKKLEQAYRMGYIYTMIVKDGDCLHVGENGYDEVYDHDIIGITMALLTMGDFRFFKEYVPHILDKVLYPDARWKYAMPFALYLQKTGDEEYIRSKLAEIRSNVHSIERDTEPSGLMKRTNAIDSLGHWTVDNWSALAGISAYYYICITLGEQNEANWAMHRYKNLLKACNFTLSELMRTENLDYIPIDITKPNEKGQRSDPRDANALSMFLFGRWSWESYLYGMPQDGVMLGLIDKTYETVLRNREGVTDSPVNFGGYPHGWYSSAYNAGYGAAALRGEKYRSFGIDAYRFMIDHAMSGPFAWWEAVGFPDAASPWSIPHAAKGGGSCPHIWGQSTATKVLLDSILCEKADGTLIICRGIPDAWRESGQRIGVENYPVRNGRVSLEISTGEKMHIRLSGCIGGRRLEITGKDGDRSSVVPENESTFLLDI